MLREDKERALAFMRCSTLREAARTAVSEVGRVLQPSACALFWASEESYRCESLSIAGVAAESLPAEALAPTVPWVRDVLASRKPLHVPDLTTSRGEVPPALGAPASLHAFPLLVGRRVRGVLVAAFGSRRELSAEEEGAIAETIEMAEVAARKGLRVDRLVAERERLEDMRQMLLDAKTNLLHEKGRIEQLAVNLQASKDTLAEAKAYTDNVISSMADLLLVVDGASRIRVANPAACDTLGYAEADLLGVPFADFLADESAAFTPSDMARLFAAGGMQSESVNLRTRGGEKVPVALSATVMTSASQSPSLVVVARDLREVQRLTSDLEQIFNSAPVGIRVIDNDFNVLSQNRAMTALTGAGPLHAVGRKCWEQLSGPHCHTEDCTVRRLARSGEERIDLEVEKEVAGGRTVPCRLQATPFRDISGRAIGVIEVVSDITETKRLTAELIRSNAELQHFAHVASHDLQEPLRKVQAFGDRLQSRYADRLDDRGRDYINRMQGAAERMQMLINNLLDFARVTSRAKPFERVDLRAVVRDVLEDLDVRVQACGAEVAVSDLATLDGDPSQLRQLLFNLVNNALKFRHSDVPPRVEITGVPRNGSYLVTVKDNGIGFDEKYAERIFGIFQRLHGRAEYEGTGIGLAICKKIAERHGGRISVTSAPGLGSTFLVDLPLRQAETSPSEEPRRE